MNSALAEAAERSAADGVRELAAQLRPALVGLIALTALTGGLFPLALFVLAHAAFPWQAAGSLITERGAVVGSHLIAQDFERPGYFHPRPSAAGSGYDATASGGSNLPPSSVKLARSVRHLADLYRRENGLTLGAPIPIDAVTASGSGLDPDISPPDAALQINRVAGTRGPARRSRESPGAGRHPDSSAGLPGGSAGFGAGPEPGPRSRDRALTARCAGSNMVSSSPW